ncbi:MAG TPA: 30S ribosomal protein S2 [Candidatus Paceibacterota bacterium]|jgi:small subunit ribosomal protein S2|nr:30S ribosomal protein S2 [Candidatus Paceibacterota bacterium]
MTTITPAALMAAGAQYGYSRSRRHPTVTPFIYGNKDGVDIIDSEKVIAQIEAAEKFLGELSASGKVVLFVGTKPEARKQVEDIATLLHQPFVTERWIGGALTNFPEIKKRIARLEELKEKRASGELAKYTKKEQLLLDREMNRLSVYFSGLVGMTKMPDAVLVVDSKKEHIAVKEARKMNIPVIAIGNTDCSLRAITYPIVANDGSVSSIATILGILKDSFKS